MLDKSSSSVAVPDCLSPIVNSEFVQHCSYLVVVIAFVLLLGKPFSPKRFSISSYPSQASIDLPVTAPCSTHLACLGDSTASVVSGLDKSVSGELLKRS